MSVISPVMGLYPSGVGGGQTRTRSGEGGSVPNQVCRNTRETDELETAIQTERQGQVTTGRNTYRTVHQTIKPATHRNDDGRDDG